MYLLGILCLVATTAALPVLSDPPTLSNSVAAAHQDSKIHTIHNAVTGFAPLHDRLAEGKDNEEVKKDIFKIASVISPPSRQLQPFDHSILKKQKTVKKHLYEEPVNQKNKNSKEEKESVIPEDSLQVLIPLNTRTGADFITGFHDCEGCANILIMTSDSALVEDKKDDEIVKNNIIIIPSILIPTLPEQPLLDYSILSKQKADLNLDSESSGEQEGEKYKGEKERVILDLGEPVEIEMLPNIATLPYSITANPVSEVSMNIPNVPTDAVPEKGNNDNEEAKMNIGKIASIVIPTPPELQPLDYSILRKQEADLNLKTEYSAKQAARKYKGEKETIILDLGKPIKVEMPPNPPTLPDSKAALPVSKVRMNILNVATDDAPEEENNDNEEAKANMAKIASIVIPTPPELPPLDYSILRKQKADLNLKTEYSAKQAAKKYKGEKETVILDLGKPVNVEMPPNPPTLPDSRAAIPVSKVRMNILNVATDAAPEEENNDNEEAKMNIGKIASIVIPTPPELQPLDYSILRNQEADLNLKTEYSTKQAARKYKGEKETIILDLGKPIKVEMPPNPPTLPDSKAALPVSKVRMNILNVATDDAPEEENNDNEEAKANMAKIASIVIPTPPELPPLDYSILRKQKADLNLKTEYSAKQAAKKYKGEKETVILDLGKPVNVEMQPNPPTLPDSKAAIPVSKVRMNILNVATEAAPEEENNDNEEAKMNIGKIASIVIPTPPELQPLDYSILRNQEADLNLKTEYSAKQAARKYKGEKETIILDLGKPIKVEMPPNPPTLPDSKAALPVSKVRMNILNVAIDDAPEEENNDNEEAKANMAKIASIVIPTPPELPPLDYSILRKQKADLNLKTEYSAKQAAKKYKGEKETVILDLGKPVNVEMPPNPPTLPDSKAALPVSKVRMNILNVATDDAPEEENNDNEEAKVNMVKIAPIVIPTPPELPPLDYSILRNQEADLNLKTEYSTKQAARKYKGEKETIILDLGKPIKVEMPPNPPTLPDSKAALPVSKVRMNILNVATDDAPEEENNDNEEAKANMAKIAPIVIPTPPELPPLDYSILRNQEADLNLKTEYSTKQAARKYKGEKETIILDLGKPIKVEMPPNPPTLPDSKAALPVSKVRMNILNVATDDAPEEENNDNEEAKANMAKIASIVIPTPPELPPLDYSILRKQKADLNLKTEYSAKQAAKKYKGEKETVILDLGKPVNVEMQPNPPTLPDSKAAIPVSKVRMNILNVATEAAPEEENNDNEEAKMNIGKIASIVILTPPELQPLDYSILRNQEADLNLKTEYSAKQAARKYKGEKETIILDLGKPIKVEMPPNPPTLPDSKAALPVSKVRMNILNVAIDDAPEEENNDNEEAKANMAKIASIVIPTPPELPPLDYSILRKQKADLNLKTEYSAKQAAKKYKGEKETVILDLGKPVNVEMPPNPPTLPDSKAALPVSKVRMNILNVATDDAPEEENNDNEEAKVNMVKIAPIVIPTPPELPPLDYSILRKQKADLNLKTEYSAKQAAKKYKGEKETVILDLVKPVNVEMPPNPPTLPDSRAAIPVSKVRMNILNVATDAAPEEENNDNEEAKMNIGKIASIVIPTPPELQPLDYSILRNQEADLNLKTEYSAKQAAGKYKGEKETIILDLGKPIKVEMPPNPPTLPDSKAALPVSKVRMNILNVATDDAPEEENNDNEEAKANMAKIASIVIPTPPELPLLDYSILRKPKADLNLKTEYSAKQAAKKYKGEKETVILDLGKPVNVEMPPNPPTLPDSKAAIPVSKVRMNILNVATDAAPEEENNDNEEAKMNIGKIASIVIPTPPELQPLDYSILRNQEANLNLKTEYSTKQAARKYKGEKETIILDLGKPIKVEMPPNPPTLPDSKAALPVSKVRMNILNVATDDAPEEENNDNDEAKVNMVKIAPIVIPTPPELPPLDYSILRKQKADLNLKTEYSAKQAAKKYKGKKETVILDLGKPVNVEMPPNPPTLPDSRAAIPVSKVRMNILNVAIDDAPEEENNDNEEAKVNMVKIAPIVIPTPPELAPLDYSILRKQKADLNLKTEYSAKQAAKKYKGEKETIILDLGKPVNVEMPPNPPTLPDSRAAIPVSKVRMNILNVATDAAPGEENNDNEEAKMNIGKIASIVIPTPPELQPLDYSILRNQEADLNLKTEYSAKQAARKYKGEKETIILDLGKPIKVEMQPNPPTLPDFKAALPVSKVRMNILNVAIDDAPEEENNDNEEAKANMAKIASIVIPTPSELPPLDYSILRKQKADLNLKTEYSAKQAAKKYKGEKETVILDLGKPVNVEMPPNPPTLPDSKAALPVSKVRMNILNVATDAAPEEENNDNEEAKMNIGKIASIVIPTPPELQPLDYSILRNQEADLNLKTEYSTKQAARKYKGEKETIILDLGKPIKVEMPPNPPTLPDSKAALPVSKVRMNILNVATDDAPEEENNDNEEAKANMAKIASIVIPTPPELPPLDYSILRKQKADLNLKTEYSAKQAAKKYKGEKETVILDLGKPVNVEMPPNPPTLPDSKAALPVSKVRMNILNVATDAAPEEENNDNEEAKMNIGKIASIVIPTPPELQPLDYSILRNQEADLNLKTEYSTKQAARKYKGEKETIILDLGKPIKVEMPPNPPTLPDSKAALPVSKVRMNILNVATDDAPEEENNDNEEAKANMAKIASIVIPTPPELPPLDYSILRKQKADLNLKTEYSAKQAAKKYKGEKETVILDLGKPVNVEMQPNPPTLPDSKAAIPVSKVRMNILNVATEAAPEEENNDNEEAKMNIGKIASIVIPTPPELQPLDYSILRKQEADLNLKTEYSAKQAARKYKGEKETVILDLGKPIKVEMPPNPPTLPDSKAALPVSKVRMNKLNVATDDAPEVENNDNEEVKANMAKIASIVIPTAPELPPLDYSILRKQKADLNLKTEYSAKQAAMKYKPEKEGVILDLGKRGKVEMLENPPTLPDSAAAHPVTEVISDSDNEQAKMNMIKIATIVIPPPPEVPLLDKSISEKQIADQNQKSIYILKHEAEKSKKEKTDFFSEKPVEKPKFIEVSKFVGDSKPVVESNPVEESKSKEEVNKEPVKHSEDIPVIIKWTIPNTPFLSKLISNCPPLPSFGLNWPFHRPSMSRCPRLIHPKFDGIIYTN